MDYVVTQVRISRADRFPISPSMASPTTETYTLSLHDALPISCDKTFHGRRDGPRVEHVLAHVLAVVDSRQHEIDRKSTRLNSSHPSISYAVFCLQQKIHNVNRARRFLPRSTLRQPKQLRWACT